MRLEIPHLRAFVTVARLGSFTRAAERLNLTQSAVSWQVRRLEQRVGHVLLDRAHDGIRPTAHGRDLLGDAERILATHDQAVDKLRRSDLEGRVRFGCAEDLIAERLAAVLSRFRRLHPGVRLEVVVDASAVLKERVEARDLDTAIIQQPAGETCGRHLWSEQALWVRGPGTAIDLSAPLPLVTFGSACIYRAAASAALEGAGLSWFPVLECFSIAGVRTAIAAGIGLGVLAGRHLDSSIEAIAQDGPLPRLPENDFVLAGPEPEAGTPLAILTELMLEELTQPGQPAEVAA